LVVQRPGIATVELLGHWSAIVWINQAANRLVGQLRGGRWNCRQRVHAKSPLIHRDPSAGHVITAADGEGCLEDGRVGLLFHEQRNVLESVVVVHAEPSTDNMPALSS